jgi:hypothetical protein
MKSTVQVVGVGVSKYEHNDVDDEYDTEGDVDDADDDDGDVHSFIFKTKNTEKNLSNRRISIENKPKP